MSSDQLCPACEALLLSEVRAEAHENLELLVDFETCRVYRCMNCSAFAAPPRDGAAWSFNLLGSAVSRPLI